MSADVKTAGSDLTTRFAAAVVMIAVAGGAVYADGWAFRALIAAGAAVMMVEWGDLHRVKRLWSWIGAALLLIPTAILPELLFHAADSQPAALDADTLAPVAMGVAGTAIAGLLYGVVCRRVAMGWGYIYIGVPAFALAVLNWAWWELVLWLMLVTWATDIFAYFVGRGVGGPKLARRISPHKTWAGLIGGMLGAGLVGAVAGQLLDIDSTFRWAGAPLALLAQFGDLYESAVKRRCGVKDSGSLLPGHGGVLDRVDGLLPVAVATLLLLLSTL
ncbi:MAG: phosphatidate cytidylyltransferase [Sphingomonadales bacterium]|jgi:phosphatidate cytidylyltransferase|nr:phosphatidate cytidylyltransferase [Sphingomonadales bacterium]